MMRCVECLNTCRTFLVTLIWFAAFAVVGLFLYLGLKLPTQQGLTPSAFLRAVVP